MTWLPHPVIWSFTCLVDLMIASSGCFIFTRPFILSVFQRLPFTLGFIGSMVGTIYVSMVLHSYILSVLFSVIQVYVSVF